MWLGLGPLAVHLDASVLDVPWAILGLRLPHPGRRVVVGYVTAAISRGAGVDAPVGFARGEFRGPGYALRVTSEARYEALLDSSAALAGALCALLIHASSRAPAFLAHAAMVRWKGGTVLFLGPSGSGKSTIAAAHPRRALGTNAAIVWRARSRRWWASPLPFTGRGDQAIAPGAYSVRGAIVLGSRMTAPRAPVEALAAMAPAIAAARGFAPPLELLVAFAGECVLRGATRIR